jgi:hypothetical protein
MPRRLLRVRTKCQVLGDALAQKLQLRFDGAPIAHRGFQRILSPRARLIKAVPMAFQRGAP